MQGSCRAKPCRGSWSSANERKIRLIRRMTGQNSMPGGDFSADARQDRTGAPLGREVPSIQARVQRVREPLIEHLGRVSLPGRYGEIELL